MAADKPNGSSAACDCITLLRLESAGLKIQNGLKIQLLNTMTVNAEKKCAITAGPLLMKLTKHNIKLRILCFFFFTAPLHTKVRSKLPLKLKGTMNKFPKYDVVHKFDSCGFFFLLQTETH